ncbi:hypothetical protein KIN20_015539 [Parelaphostrongylus tenuis]|uniref:Uncharacterized protein n=1 Tax=Parelaphostrongylus tenuis TaxID=148309 RepID=A0AAD5N4B1_PARTN|nr:hypothetical protein KIN20_015539 [Parelaphostrongylus tenuis]
MRRCVLSAANTCPIGNIPLGGQRASIRQFEEIPGPTTFSRLFDKNRRTLFRRNSAISDYFDWLVELHNRYGSIVKVHRGFGRGYIVHIFDPEDARKVFAADGRQPLIVPLQETTQRYREMKGMNPGLGNLNGDEWYRLRSSVQQAMMRPQAVHKYLPYTNEVAAALVNHIREEAKKNKGEVSFREIAGRYRINNSA